MCLRCSDAVRMREGFVSGGGCVVGKGLWCDSGGGGCVLVQDRCETGNGLMGLDEGGLCDMWEKAVFQAR